MESVLRPFKRMRFDGPQQSAKRKIKFTELLCIYKFPRIDYRNSSAIKIQRIYRKRIAARHIQRIYRGWIIRKKIHKSKYLFYTF